MSASDLSALVASLFAGLSVLFAVYTWRRSEDKTAYARLRLALVDLRQDIRQLDALLAEPLFTEVSTNISDEIGKIAPPNPTGAALIEFLAKPENHDYIAQAIHLGLRRSHSVEQAERLMAALSRVPYEFREQLPAVAKALESVTFYVARTVSGTVSPILFNQIIGNPQAVTRLGDEGLVRVDAPVLVLREAALMLDGACKSLLRARGQQVVDEARTLLDLLIDNLSVLTDSALRAESKSQRARAREIAQIAQPTQIETAFECFKLVRGLFSEHEWDRVVEAKTKLYVKAHQKETEDGA